MATIARRTSLVTLGLALAQGFQEIPTHSEQKNINDANGIPPYR